MSKETDIFIKFLKSKGLKLTGQRAKVLNCFLNTESHVSVEDLYGMIKKKEPNIGHATVFRTVKLLCEADIAKAVDLGDKRVRYEHKLGHKYHIHLICVRCGALIESTSPEFEALERKICNTHGFFPQKHAMEIFGICKRCRKKSG